MNRIALRGARLASSFSAERSGRGSSSARWACAASVGAAGLGAMTFALPQWRTAALAEEASAREFTLEEVRAHASAATGIWVIHGGSVYDVSEFIAEHPGGPAKILLAAGGSVEPFWKLYKQHDAPAVREKLASMRIGALAAVDADALSAEQAKDTSDPYSTDPERHPALNVVKEKPFNAETPTALIAEQWITPNELWYCRHHHPVPVVDPETFELTVEIEEPLHDALRFERGARAATEIKVSLADLKARYPKREVTTTLQCAGNRRGELSEHGKTSGLQWKHGVLSTATWGGVYLRDLLADGLTLSEETAERIGVEHVQFRAIDAPYDASVPLHRAVSRHDEVLIAYEMNGEELPREHGYPLRVIVPGEFSFIYRYISRELCSQFDSLPLTSLTITGCVGARNVKWVDKIVVSTETAHSVWQRSVQYRGCVAQRAFAARSRRGRGAFAAPCARTVRSARAAAAG